MTDNIRVYCRFKPSTQDDHKIKGRLIDIVNDSSLRVSKVASDEKDQKADSKSLPEEFTFDRVFDGSVGQQVLYEATIKDSIRQLLDGINLTVFSYGRTSSGKTFTMLGQDTSNPTLKGLCPRMIEDIFSEASSRILTHRYSISLSVVEIYNEQIIDLLGCSKSTIRIRQKSNGGVQLQGATETVISDETEALRLIKIAINNRSVASTSFNEKSSRSHLVIIMSLFISLTNGQEVKCFH